MNDGTETNSKVSMKTKLSYGFGGFGKDWGLNMVNVFLMIYYTDVVGVSPAFIGALFLVARIWDTVNDPMLGYIVARTNSRWGKYKPWILVGNILNAICIVALFSAHLLEGSSQLVFICVTYILWGMTYTMLDAPFWSLIPTITLDRKEREGLMPYPRIFTTAASYLVGAVGVYAVNYFGNGDKGTGYLLFGVIGAIFAILSALVTCAWTEQKVESNVNNESMFSLRAAKNVVMKNDQFLLVVVIGFCYLLAGSSAFGLNLYFFKYVLGDETLFSQMMIFAGISGAASLILFPKVVDRIGRANLFKFALLSPLGSMLLLYVAATLHSDSIVLIGFSGILAGISNSLYWLVILLMVADSVDYGHVKLNIRSESILYSVNTMVVKCCFALMGFLVGVFLSIIGYVPNEVQSESTLNSLTIVYVAPSILYFVAYLIYSKKYALNGSKLDEIQQQLESNLKSEAKRFNDSGHLVNDNRATSNAFNYART